MINVYNDNTSCKINTLMQHNQITKIAVGTRPI